MKTEQAHKMMDDALTALASALEGGRSEALTTYLAAMARFHHYSFGNVMLIVAQNPDATRVAGFHTWRKLGRSVKRGEKGIAILAPMTFHRRPKGDVSADDDAGADEDRRPDVWFRAVYVFDVAQTEGEPLPEFAAVRGDPGAYADRLKACIAERGIELRYSESLGGADGRSSCGRITLRTGLDPAEEFSTLAHEFAHELLHQGPDAQRGTRRSVELEAEAVAFVVCQSIGLDTNTASSDYIQLYHGDREALEASLSAIRQTASHILDGLAIEP